MQNLSVVLLLSLLSGCAEVTYSLRYVDPAAIQATCHPGALNDTSIVQYGCSNWGAGNVCRLSVRDDEDTDTTRKIIEHEIKHCFKGSYHGPNYTHDNDTDLAQYDTIYQSLVRVPKGKPVLVPAIASPSM